MLNLHMCSLEMSFWKDEKMKTVKQASSVCVCVCARVHVPVCLCAHGYSAYGKLEPLEQEVVSVLTWELGMGHTFSAEKGVQS